MVSKWGLCKASSMNNYIMQESCYISYLARCDKILIKEQEMGSMDTKSSSTIGT